MNKIFSITVLSVLLILYASCQKDLPSVNSTVEYSRVIFSVDPYDFDDVATKLTPSISSSGVSYLWAQGDTVGIYPDAGSQLVFPVVDYGSTTSSFDGGAWNLSSEHSYYAYVPFVPDIRLDRSKVPVDFRGQHQCANADATGLRDYVFMSAAGTPPAGKDLVFNFKRLGCLLWISLDVDAGAYTSLSMSLEDGMSLPVVGTFDLTTTSPDAAPDLTITKSESEWILKLDDIEIVNDGSTLSCYMMAPPVDLGGKTIKFTLMGTNGKKVYTVAGKDLKKSGAVRLSPSEIEGIIYFKDKTVHDICVAEWDTNGNGELEYTEAEVVTSIPDRLFAWERIKSFDELQYYTSIDRIGESAFQGCSSLESVIFPVGNTFYIDAHAFDGCGMLRNSQTLSISHVGESSFMDCRNLGTEIILTEEVIEIPDRAFQSCQNIPSIEIPQSVAHIGSYAFNGCESITSITLPDNVTAGAYGIFAYCGITNIEIPSSWKELGDDFFCGCRNLTSVEIPDNIKRLGDRAFLSSGLANISLPEGLLVIDGNCFKDCDNLTSITIPPLIKEIAHGTFGDCANLSEVVLPEGLKAILSSDAEGAFADCPNLRGIILPSSLTYIGEYSFINTGLRSIVIPDNVTYVGRAAMERCFDLTECVLSENLKTIPVGVLEFTSLSTIRIPANVEFIAARLPDSLTELYSLSTIPPSLFDKGIIPDNGCPIYVPGSAIDTYRNASVWSIFADRIQAMPGGGAGGDSGGPDNWE